MKYINKVTGAVIDIPCVLSGGDWQAAEPAASSKKKKTKVAPVQQEGGTDERICDSWRCGKTLEGSDRFRKKAGCGITSGHFRQSATRGFKSKKRP